MTDPAQIEADRELAIRLQAELWASDREAAIALQNHPTTAAATLADAVAQAHSAHHHQHHRHHHQQHQQIHDQFHNRLFRHYQEDRFAHPVPPTASSPPSTAAPAASRPPIRRARDTYDEPPQGSLHYSSFPILAADPSYRYPYDDHNNNNRGSGSNNNYYQHVLFPYGSDTAPAQHQQHQPSNQRNHRHPVLYTSQHVLGTGASAAAATNDSATPAPEPVTLADHMAAFGLLPGPGTLGLPLTEQQLRNRSFNRINHHYTMYSPTAPVPNAATPAEARPSDRPSSTTSHADRPTPYHNQSLFGQLYGAGNANRTDNPAAPSIRHGEYNYNPNLGMFVHERHFVSPESNATSSVRVTTTNSRSESSGATTSDDNSAPNQIPTGGGPAAFNFAPPDDQFDMFNVMDSVFSHLMRALPPSRAAEESTLSFPRLFSEVFGEAGLPGAFFGDGERSYEDWQQLIDRMGSASRGATEEEISHLPTEIVSHPRKVDTDTTMLGAASSSSAAQSDREPEKCPICLGEYEDGDVIKRLPCMHAFCDGCISRWLRTSKECPCCKASIRDPPNATRHG